MRQSAGATEKQAQPTSGWRLLFELIGGMVYMCLSMVAQAASLAVVGFFLFLVFSGDAAAVSEMVPLGVVGICAHVAGRYWKPKDWPGDA